MRKPPPHTAGAFSFRRREAVPAVGRDGLCRTPDSRPWISRRFPSRDPGGARYGRGIARLHAFARAPDRPPGWQSATITGPTPLRAMPAGSEKPGDRLDVVDYVQASRKSGSMRDQALEFGEHAGRNFCIRKFYGGMPAVRPVDPCIGHTVAPADAEGERSGRMRHPVKCNRAIRLRRNFRQRDAVGQGANKGPRARQSCWVHGFGALAVPVVLGAFFGELVELGEQAHRFRQSRRHLGPHRFHYGVRRWCRLACRCSAMPRPIAGCRDRRPWRRSYRDACS